MLAKRIIPCLDVRDGKVVKGVKFEGVRDVGDPVALAQAYNEQGADEIVFYDITASYEKRGVILDVVREAAKKIFVPLTVGGGIKSIDDFRETLRAGADKVSINSQAVQNPSLIREAADIFGCQCVCVGIDAKKIGDHKWTVFINGARVDMHLDLIDWVKQCEQLGAGEICLNSIDADGTKEGFDLPMLKAVCDAVSIPVICAGGVADGRGMAAARIFGAEGVQCGTIFLSAEECNISQQYKDMVYKANDISTVVTGRASGHPVRSLKSPLSRRLVKMEGHIETRTLEEIEMITAGSLRKAVQDGNVEEGTFMSGQIAGLVNGPSDCKTILETIVGDAERILTHAPALIGMGENDG